MFAGMARNRFGSFLALFVASSFIPFARSEVQPHSKYFFQFTSVDAGTAILGRKDEFIERLSLFDRAARMKTDRVISEAEFLEFVRKNVLSWTGAERTKIEAALAKITPALEALELSLPQPITLIKTTGAEEGNAFYTRDTAIVLPVNQLGGQSVEPLEKILAHEIFHIWSRRSPELREKLYQSIGFTKCPEAALPPEMNRRKITNPDAPRNDHAILVQFSERDVSAVPILLSAAEKYDPKRGGEFFQYLQLKFMLSPSHELVELRQVGGFFEQVGHNTDYIIHPEEILADNFALLVLGRHDVASPQILEKMRRILTEK
jgi:hypothetical protein